MARNGRISLNVDSPLRSMLIAMRTVPADVPKQVAVQTKKAGQPIWEEEIREGADTRLRQRVLVDSARVGVTQRNVFLRSGGVGTLRSGTPVIALAQAVEFGVGADKKVTTRSRAGKTYTRRMGTAFPRKHLVFTPAVSRSIVRFASLWIQTAVRTLLDRFEGK